MERKIVITGVTLLLTGIILGAFGAHALKNALVAYPEKIVSFETGVRYQIYGGFSFLILGLCADKFSMTLNGIYKILLIGHLMFSVSIYFLALAPLLKVKMSFLGPVTPIGGAFIIVGWFVLLLKLLKKN